MRFRVWGKGTQGVCRKGLVGRGLSAAVSNLHGYIFAHTFVAYMKEAGHLTFEKL